MTFDEIMAKLARGKGDEVVSVLQTQFNEEFLNTTDDGKNLLHYCALSDKNIAAAKIILKSAEFRSRFNINATDEKGLTPLHMAAINGSRAIAILLMDNGADKLIEVPTDRGNFNAIRFAARSGRLELANEIERYVPRPQRRNTAEKENQTPTEIHDNLLNVLAKSLTRLFTYKTERTDGYHLVDQATSESKSIYTNPRFGSYQKQD